jgi:hypothetical protein
VQAQIRLWPTAPPCQMRQDKLLELFRMLARISHNDVTEGRPIEPKHF